MAGGSRKRVIESPSAIRHRPSASTIRAVRIALDHVSHDYGSSEESAAVHVLDDVSLTIASGDFAVLMGASGSGKSTLLNLMGAVDRPTAGRVVLGDTDTSVLSERDLTQLRRVHIGFVFQFFNLIPTLTVFENVAFPLSLARRPKSEIAARVNEVLQRVQLDHRAKHFPNELSGGEMQRVAIGRAVIHRPPLLLADEPTGNLDSKTGATILELLRDIHREQKPTIVMATHSATAAEFGDYVVRIADGRMQ
jgi:putative ABC transport system ATP-binding protein